MILNCVHKKRPQVGRTFALLLAAICIAGKTFSQTAAHTFQKIEKIYLKDRPAPVILATTIKHNPFQPPARFFTSYGVDDGLAIESVSSGFKDSNNNLWFATLGGGVSKFDGTTFTTYDMRHGLNNTLVRSVAQDNSGNLYFGTAAGLSMYDGNHITNFDASSGFPSSAITALVTDHNGILWCGTMGAGLVRFDGKRPIVYDGKDGLPNATIRALQIDKQGVIWIGTEQGLAVYNESGIESMDEHLLGTQAVYDIHEDKTNRLWLGTSDGIFLYDDGILTPFAPGGKRVNTSIIAIGESGDGTLWFGRKDGGVIRFDGTKVEEIKGVAEENQVTGMVTDANGNVWLCTQGRGILRHNGNSLLSFSSSHGLTHNQVWAIAEGPDGSLWFAHENGLSKYDGSTFTSIETPNRIVSFITIAVDSNGIVWTGGPNGLSRWDGRNLTTYTTKNGLTSDRIYDIVIDELNHIWLCTQAGITKFDGDAFTNITLEDDKSDTRTIRAFVDNSGIIWVSTSKNLFKIRDNHPEPIHIPEINGQLVITSFAQDAQGYYWFGTPSGLIRYDNESTRMFLANDGLTNPNIFDIDIDPYNDDLWIGTNQGLIRLRFKDSSNNIVAVGNMPIRNHELDKIQPVWTEVNKRTGYPLADLTYRALLISRNKLKDHATFMGTEIWAAFPNKLFQLHLPHNDSSESPPASEITGLLLDGQPIPWKSLIGSFEDENPDVHREEQLVLGKVLSNTEREDLRKRWKSIKYSSVQRFTHLPENLVLPHFANQVTFTFSARNLSNTPVKFQYRLVGQDNLWIESGKDNQVTFLNLWEGKYSFEVRTRSSISGWSKPATFSFKVMPPWYRSLPMYTIYLACLAALVLLLIRFREKKLKEEKIRLQILVSQRTLELEHQTKEALRQKRMVEEKNEEIRAQLKQTEEELSNQTLDMIQRQNLFNSIEAEIEKVSTEKNPEKIYNKLTSLIKVNKTLEKEWETFNRYFRHVHQDFYNKLDRSAPTLSVNEQRLAALIRMNMDNRQISVLLAIEPSSVKMAKYRLKKKLQLDDSVDLSKYISTL